MQSRDFCYWLQGFFELSGESGEIGAAQAATIRRHLDMVFAHELNRSLFEREPARKPVAPPRPKPAPPPKEESPALEPLPQPTLVPPPAPMC